MLARLDRAAMWLRLALACLALSAAAPAVAACPDLPVAAQIASAQPERSMVARAARITARARPRAISPPHLRQAAWPLPDRPPPPRIPLFVSHCALLR
jgi:hypothetical protein